VAFDSHFLKSRLIALNQDDIEGRYAVALSGGADSVALLIALSECMPCERIVALHFDHGIHTDSADWAQYCQGLCARKEIAFRSTRWQEQDAGKKQQEATAREARYQWFAREMGETDLLLTGHHLDDQAETVMMSLFEGRSLNRVAGMRSIRSLQFGGSQFVLRPLLNIRRIELQQFLKDRGVEWIEDPANSSDSHARSWVRTEVIPLISQRWPSVVSNIDRIASQLTETLEIVETAANKAILEHARPARRTLFCGTDPLCLAPLMSGSEGHFYAVLRQWIYKGGVSSPSRKQLKELYRQLRDAGSEQHCRLSLDGAEIVFFDEHLFVIQQHRFSIEQDIQAYVGQDSVCAGLKVTYALGRQGFDKEILHAPDVYWRMRQSNDRFTVSKKSGPANLKKAMQEAKLAPWLRHSVPLLVQNGEVVWAYGLGVSAQYRVCDSADSEGVMPMFKID